jgi:hypothetical protein
MFEDTTMNRPFAGFARHRLGTCRSDSLTEVFQIVARQRLLPKEAWSLSKDLHANVKPEVNAHIHSDMVVGTMHGVLFNHRAVAVKLTMTGPVAHAPLVWPRSVASLTVDGRYSLRHDLIPFPEHITELALLKWYGVGHELVTVPGRVRSLTVPAGIRMPVLPPGLEELNVYGGPRFVASSRCDDDAISMENLPRGLRILKISIAAEIEPIDLWIPPPSLEVIEIGSDLGIDLDHGTTYQVEPNRQFDSNISCLPKSLEVMYMRSAVFNRSLGRLPDRLLHLEFSDDTPFNLPLGPLPPTLQALILGESFSRSLDVPLPASLEILSISSRAFDHELGALPPKLRVLRIHEDGRFDRPLGAMPASMRTLHLDARYSHPMKLPSRLRDFRFGSESGSTSHVCYSHELGGLPSRLSRLSLGITYLNLLGPLPRTLRKLHLSGFVIGDLMDLPPCLRTLDLHSVTNGRDVRIGVLPPRLASIRLPPSFNAHLGPLPRELYHLETGHAFDMPFERLPDGVRILNLGDSYSYALPTFPPKLEYLCLGMQYMHALPRMPGLKMLQVGEEYFHHIDVDEDTVVVVSTGSPYEEEGDATDDDDL